VSALEAAQNPAGQAIGFWAMANDCRPMTSQEIENGIAAVKADAPENARVISVSLAN
jgi:hypothetical protein